MDKLRVLVVGVLFSLCACSIGTGESGDVKQDTIHQSLLAQYHDLNGDELTGSLYMRARFRFNDATGTTLSLTSPSKVEHQTLSLSKATGLNSALGTYYSASKTLSPFVADHTFKFTDTEGKTFENSITIIPINFNSPPTTISKAAGATIQFTDGAVLSNQSVTLQLSTVETSVEDGSTATSSKYEYIEADSGSTSMIIPSSKLVGFDTGTAIKLRLVRVVRNDLSQATSAGGSIWAQYYSRTISVTLTE